MVDKISITIVTGSIDRLTGMAILVSGAAAMDMEVDIFLQLWGVYAFKKDVMRKNMEFSEHKEMAESTAKRLQELNLPMWFDMLKEAKDIGNVHIYACSTACRIWNVGLNDLELVDEIIGAGAWLEKSKDANITWNY